MRRLPATALPTLAALLLSACQLGGAGHPLDSCGASGLAPLVTTPVAAADLSGHEPLRIIPPGTAVTMDHRPDRLNVETDAAGIITRIFCG